VEEPFELRRHTAPLRATLMSAFLHCRSGDLIDHLVDFLVQTVHRMGKKAERRIDAGLGEALQKAAGKMAKLHRIAKAAVDAPKGCAWPWPGRCVPPGRSLCPRLLLQLSTQIRSCDSLPSWRQSHHRDSQPTAVQSCRSSHSFLILFMGFILSTHSHWPAVRGNAANCPLAVADELLFGICQRAQFADTSRSSSTRNSSYMSKGLKSQASTTFVFISSNTSAWQRSVMMTVLVSRDSFFILEARR